VASGSCEYGGDPSGYIKGGKFAELLSDSAFKDSVSVGNGFVCVYCNERNTHIGLCS
jgi:hypothetical protein